MRAIVQRVKKASVSINNVLYSEIGKGITVLLGIKTDDSDKEVDYIIDKLINLRIFDDENGVMNLSLSELQLEMLVVSNFTVYGDTKKGRRPNYMQSAKPENANLIYEKFLFKLKEKNIKFKSGVFREMMDVSIVNDGPVTLIIES